MTDVFLERDFDPPIGKQDVLDLATKAGSCFNLHSVEWGASFLSPDGGNMICHFIGRDAESVRIALHQVGSDTTNLWPGTVHDRPDLEEEEARNANVVVLRCFDDPVAIEDIQALEDAGAWCLEARSVKFIRSFFSLDRKRMLCLYHAPDAESVRQAQQQADMPLEKVWAITRIGMEDFQTSTHSR